MIANPISIIIMIITYNGEYVIERCISSVLKQNFNQKFEILIVDNKSSDNTVKLIKKNWPELKLIVNPKNYGFGKANNIGIKSTQSKYIVFLNQDSQVDEQWLKELVNSMEKNLDVACCGAKELPYEKTKKEVIRKSTDINNQIWMGCGSAIFRRSTLVQAGLFDEFYFMYCEDIDLSFTLKILGWRIMLNEKAKWYHEGHDRAILSYDDARLFHSWRGRIYLILKFGSFKQIVNFLFFRKTQNKNTNLNNFSARKKNNSFIYKINFILTLFFSLMPQIGHIIKSKYKMRKLIKDQSQVDSWIEYINKQFYFK